MIKQAPNIQSIQRDFQDLNTLLVRTIGRLSGTGNPTISTVIQDITRISQSLTDLEQKVGDHLKARQNQLEALIGVGQAINCSPGQQRVLEGVMDAVVKIM